GRTALHRAVSSGNESIVDLLLRQGANASLQDESGKTPLHLAAECGRKEIVARLLEKLPDPS
ncbi:ankyrin repeat-containing domain protein, partial [Colletotrichum cereale]